MKRSVLISGVIAMALLLPAIATAAVVVNNGIALNVASTHQNMVYLAAGPGYQVANNSGFMAISGNNEMYTNLTINLTAVPGSGYIILTNVLEIYNATASSGTVFVWLNGSLPAGVSIYESGSPITFNGNTLSGTEILGGGVTAYGPIQLIASGPAAYIAFKLQGAVSGQASLTLQYTVS